MRWLNRVLWLQLFLAGLAVAGLFLDSRELLGVSVWLKPLKFTLSIFIYLLTLRWMLGLFAPGVLRVERLVLAIAVAMAVEIGLIFLQSARGVTSHFNQSPGFDGAVFNVMGLFILINTLAAAHVAKLYWRSPPINAPGLLWGIRWGLMLLLAGSAEAIAMLANNAHTVGAADGGPGWLLTNWSLRHGDLRGAHAIGLHGMQALPLAGWLVDRWRLPRPAVLVGMAAVIYSVVFLFTLRQALAGRPVL